MFEQMQGQPGCSPDVVTYTALISAFEKGGQWRLALSAYERMRCQGCKADAIVFNAIIDALGPLGVTGADGPASTFGRDVLHTLCLTIAGGTSEVQRNVIGERMLGLPRDPEPQS